ncbi:hypothetical protein SNEBB_006388 [Seison nebaliae]|nr:hypothetical protein SNEBB_006388 [Seison nebaliae]
MYRPDGCIGGQNVLLQLDMRNGYLASAKLDAQKLTVRGISGFSPIRSNVLIFSGKWQYEVILLTKGLMQIGWCTPSCHFYSTQGAGDSEDSYAYDGDRVRKWNVESQHYGEAWLVGDVIGCLLNYDEHYCQFYRNGKSLGVAYDDIRIGYDIYYLPAMSLSANECVRVNFGATPFIYPVDGFDPLNVRPSIVGEKRCQLYLDLLKKLFFVNYRLLSTTIESLSMREEMDGEMFNKKLERKEDDNEKNHIEFNSMRLLEMEEEIDSFHLLKWKQIIIVHKIISQFNRIFHIRYLIEKYLLPFLHHLLTTTNLNTHLELSTNDYEYSSNLLTQLFDDVSKFELNKSKLSPHNSFIPFNNKNRIRPRELIGNDEKKEEDDDLSDTSTITTPTTMLNSNDHFNESVSSSSNQQMRDISLIPHHHMNDVDDLDDPFIHETMSYEKQLMKETGLNVKNLKIVQQLFDLLWEMNDEEMTKAIFNSLFNSICHLYGMGTRSIKYSFHRNLLIVAQSLFSHRPTCRWLMNDKNFIYHFISLIDIQAPSEHYIHQFFPIISMKFFDISKLAISQRQLHYKLRINLMKNSIGQLEDIQIELFKLIFFNSSNQMGLAIQFHHLSNEWKEMVGSFVVSMASIRNLTHRLCRFIQSFWNDSFSNISSIQNAYVLPYLLVNNDYLNTSRFGGEFTSVAKDHRDILQQYRRDISSELFNKSENSSSHSSSTISLRSSLRFPRFLSYSTTSRHPHFHDDDEKICRFVSNNSSDTQIKSISQTTLLILLNSTIRFFNDWINKKLIKTCSLKSVYNDFGNLLKHTRIKRRLRQRDLKRMKDIHPKICRDPILMSLMNAEEVFAKEIINGMRHLAWVYSAILSEDKFYDFLWMSSILFNTIQFASNNGELLRFIPILYLQTAMALNSIHINYFGGLTSSVLPPAFNEIIQQFIQLICNLCSDQRICHSEYKDIVLQELACFPYHRMSRERMYNLSLSTRQIVIQRILTNNDETHSWVLPNYVLISFWKGYGFGFRYTHPPHILLPRRHYFGKTFNICSPSQSAELFHKEIGEYLVTHRDEAKSYANFIINQLNMVFSEFINILHKIPDFFVSGGSKTLSTNENNQIRICSACFEFTIALLRTLEFLFYIAPSCIIDEKSEIDGNVILVRICQILNQIFNRLNSKDNALDLVTRLQLSNMPNVDRYPIISACIGILIRMATLRNAKNRDKILEILFIETGLPFQNIIELIGNDEESISETSTISNHSPFEKKDSNIQNKFQSTTTTTTTTASLLSPTLSISSSSSMDNKSMDHLNYGLLPNFVYRKYSICEFKLIKYKGNYLNSEEINVLQQTVEYISNFLQKQNEYNKSAEDNKCIICYSRDNEAKFKPCGHEACRSCMAHYVSEKSECFFCKANVNKVCDMNGQVIKSIKISKKK